MTQTAFTILSGQGESLNIDPQHFYSHVYKTLPQLTTGKYQICWNMNGGNLSSVMTIFCASN